MAYVVKTCLEALQEDMNTPITIIDNYIVVEAQN